MGGNYENRSGSHSSASYLTINKCSKTKGGELDWVMTCNHEYGLISPLIFNRKKAENSKCTHMKPDCFMSTVALGTPSSLAIA